MIEALSMNGITKVYDNGFVANNNVNLSLNEGEIHALVGENGAGKTTLMNILFGFIKAEKGEILLKGEPANITDPFDAIKKGIGMVHQHFMLVPSLSIAENIVLGNEPHKRGLFDKEFAIEETEKISEKYNLHVDPKALVKDISVGLKQKVEILKALYRGADILVLDEPTALLTPQETKELFVELKGLRDLGHTIVFISHKLEEVEEICDRFTVLRRGETVGTGSIKDVTKQKLSELMVGRSVNLDIHKDKPILGEKVLEVKNLSYSDNLGNPMLRNITFDLKAGMILGIAGIEGNGQSELSEIISGLATDYTGSIVINNEDIKGKTIREIRENGFAHIPEDRMTLGASSTASVKENIIIDSYYTKEFSKNYILKQKEIDKYVNEKIREFTVKCSDADDEVGSLSGGNIQKAIVARELSSDSSFVLANHPTRGIDIGSTVFIRNYLVNLSRQTGKGILLISADIGELLEAADSIMVMRDGEIVGYFEDASKTDEFELGEYMLGLQTAKFGGSLK